MRMLMKYLTWVAVMVAIFTIAGCGNGGNSGSKSVVTLSSGATASELVAISNANMQISSTSTVSATFYDLTGKPIPGLAVTFTTTSGTFSPSSGLATTDANGTATIQLIAPDAAGTGIITASAIVSGVKVSNVATFAVALPQVYLSTPALGVTTALGPNGSTSVTVNLTDATGKPYSIPVDVTFTSNFATAGKATLVSPVRSVNGQASSTYTAAGGVGTDTITVSAGGATATVNVTVNGAAANSISFVSATPQNIALKGMGGAGGSETSTVVFKVLDTSGQPKVGQQVDFSLNTTVGGLALTSTSGSSASDGSVSTTVLSGIVATPVRVTATVHGSSPVIATQSDQLSVSTGIPTQSGMSLSVATHNVEAATIDGTSDVFTVFLSDHFGNPVPDKTAVNFSAQVGQIQPYCLTSNGRCSVTWTSSGTRTADGRAAILAYAIGEESFTDLNGNGVADGTCPSGFPTTKSLVCGEFTDTTQAWRDDLHIGSYGPGDVFIDFNGSGKVDRDGVFNGVLNGSGTGPRTKHVFANNVIVMSTSDASITLSSSSIDAATASGPATSDVTGKVQDTSSSTTANPMPAGSAIALTSLSSCLGISPNSFTVPSTTVGPNPFTFMITNSCATGATGNIIISVTSPSGVVTTKKFTLTW